MHTELKYQLPEALELGVPMTELFLNLRYEMSNCLFEATLQKIEASCNCTPKYFVDISDGFEACEGSSKKCMNDFLAQIGDKRHIIHDGTLKACLTSMYQMLNTNPSN